MTVVADKKKRIVLTQAEPGDRFDLQASPNSYVLRKLEPVESKPAKVRFIKRDGDTVAVMVSRGPAILPLPPALPRHLRFEARPL
jgi:hypothetical protein